MDKFKKILLSVIVLTLVLVTYAYSTDKKEYTISFDSDGGTAITNKIVKNGQTIIIPEPPVKEGYKFLGWMYNNKTFDFTTKIKEDIKLVAAWEKIEDDEIPATKINVTFDSNGGSKVENVELDSGSTLSRPINPTREGYKFIGWYHNDTVWDFSTKVNTNITLVAKWEKTDTETSVVKPVENITVTFDSNGGSKVPTQRIKVGSRVTKPANPTKAGYKFIGWYRDNSIWNFLTKLNTNITLVAKWEKEAAVPKEDIYTIEVKPVDEFSLDVYVYVYKNGTNITNQVSVMKAGESILAEYLANKKALKGNKAQYTKNKNNVLTIVLNNGNEHKITKN